MTGLHIAVVTEPEDFGHCLALRRAVFIVEQQVAEADEVDGQDPQCAHVLARLNGVPVGAARYQPVGDYVKIQRVCVARNGRGQGIGAALIRFIVEQVRTEGQVRTVKLGAQTHALNFYAALGFEPFGPEYMDAGIAHRDMVLTLG